MLFFFRSLVFLSAKLSNANYDVGDLFLCHISRSQSNGLHTTLPTVHAGHQMHQTTT